MLPTGGVHNDVLQANPTDDDGKKRLVEEIKGRAKSILGSTKNYKEAVALYAKAIEIYPEESVLYGNRSMCHLGMNNKKSALEDANKAIELNPAYAKAYFRKAMADIAMEQYEEAYAALLENKKLAPEDKSVSTQITKVQGFLDKKAASGAKVKVPKSVVPTATNTVGVSSTAKPITSSPATKPAVSADKEKVVETTPGSGMKGYKITSDGKKTSYFNNELTDEAKQLIGDIRPKKIEATPAPVATSGNSGSSWNSAGTFESKNVTPWCKEYLENALSNVDFTVPRVFPHPAASAPNSSTSTLSQEMATLDIHISINKVSNVNGDASTIFNRNKKKYIYDFSADCEWKLIAYNSSVISVFTSSDGSKPPSVLSANGILKVMDITTGGEDDIEFDVEVKDTKNNSNNTISNQEIQGIIKTYIRASGNQGAVVDKLQVAVKQACKKFDTDFKEMK